MLTTCDKFFGAYISTLPQIAQNIKCATSNHAMRQIWRNAPRLATPDLKNRNRDVDIEKLHQLQLEKLQRQITLNNDRYTSLTYLKHKVLYRYQYFLQETGRLSSLANCINLYSLCCTFASGSHPIVRDSDFKSLLFNLQQITCIKILNCVASAAHFKPIYRKPVT